MPSLSCLHCGAQYSDKSVPSGLFGILTCKKCAGIHLIFTGIPVALDTDRMLDEDIHASSEYLGQVMGGLFAERLILFFESPSFVAFRAANKERAANANAISDEDAKHFSSVELDQLDQLESFRDVMGEDGE